VVSEKRIETDNILFQRKIVIVNQDWVAQTSIKIKRQLELN